MDNIGLNDMNELSGLDALLAGIEPEVMKAEQEAEQLANSEKLATDAQSKIEAHYRLNRLFVRWGMPEAVPVANRLSNVKQLMAALHDGSLCGKAKVSYEFLNSCHRLLEYRLRRESVKVNGLLKFNVQSVKRELKSLRGRLVEMKELRLSIDETLSVSFIDKDLPYTYILDKLIEILTRVIDKGFKFKKTKRYVSECKQADTPTIYIHDKYEMYGGGLILADKVTNPSGTYKKAYTKGYYRKIRQLISMPVISVNTDGTLKDIERYSKKQLPLYLQD